MVRGSVAPGTVPCDLSPVPTLVLYLPGTCACGMYPFEAWRFASGTMGHQTQHCLGGDNEHRVSALGTHVPSEWEERDL